MNLAPPGLVPPHPAVWAGLASSGGFSGRQRDGTLAADRSPLPPSGGTVEVAVGDESMQGAGPPLQRRFDRPEPATRLVRSALEASCQWCLHSKCRMGP